MTYQTIEYTIHPDIVRILLDPNHEQSDLAEYVGEWKEWATDDFTDADDNQWQWAGEMMVLPGTHPAECEITYQPALCRTVQMRFALVRQPVSN